MPYIKLDHRLKPRKLEDINDTVALPDHKKEKETKKGRYGTFLVNKYNIEKKQVQHLIPLFVKYKQMEEKKGKDVHLPGSHTSKVTLRDICYTRGKKDGKIMRCYHIPSKSKEEGSEWKKEDEIVNEELEAVIGPDKEVNYDQDWGLMSAVLACYNNHWVLKSGPDDWWTVVGRRIAAALDEHREKEEVRKFFVDHDGQKQINIDVGSLADIDYSSLLTQFSKEIRRNIKTPGYVDLMQADFSTTKPQQLVISQIMLMASVKKYFSFGISARCGIPGVELKGTEEDWEKLLNKLQNLENHLMPILEHLNLKKWFISTQLIFSNLLKTYKGKPDIDWWGHILCWNEAGRSGLMRWFSGWFPEFLGCNNNPSGPNDFPSGLVTVPLHIEDECIVDDGLLVAGTLGFTVSSGSTDALVVEPHNTWSLLLPVNSPITPRLKPSGAINKGPLKIEGKEGFGKGTKKQLKKVHKVGDVGEL